MEPAKNLQRLLGRNSPVHNTRGPEADTLGQCLRGQQNVAGQAPGASASRGSDYTQGEEEDDCPHVCQVHGRELAVCYIFCVALSSLPV